MKVSSLLAYCCTLFLPIVNAKLGETHSRILEENEGDTVDLIIKYKNEKGKHKIKEKAQVVKRGLKHVKAIAASVKRTDIAAIENDVNVEYVTLDDRVYQHDYTPPGIQAVQGDFRPRDAVASPVVVSGSCLDDASIKVAIIDSGIDASHPDLCGDMKDKDAFRCAGESFVGDKKAKWFEPGDAHGKLISGEK